MTAADRHDCFIARRIIRSESGSRTNRNLLRNATERQLRLAEILQSLLENCCIAEAERLAIVAITA